MNKILQNYRAKFPDDGRTDTEVILELGEKLTKSGYNLKDYEDFHSDYLGIQRSLRPDLLEEGTRGLKRGVDNLQGSLYGLTALAGDALNATSIPLLDTVGESVRDFGREGFERNVAEASENPASVPSFRDVAGVQDVPSYLTGLLGEAVPSIAESIGIGAAGAIAGSATAPGPGTIAGGVGGFLGKQTIKSYIKTQLRKELTEEVGETVFDNLAKARTRKELFNLAEGVGDEFKDDLGRVLRQAQAARFSTLGVVGDSIAQNTGSTYNELYEKGAGQSERITNALIGGSVAGAIDAITPTTILKKWFPGMGTKSLGAQAEEVLDIGGNWQLRFAKTLAETAGTEGATEALQELIQEMAVKNGVDDYQIDRKELIDRMINAGIAGALAGGLAGSPGALADARKSSSSTSADVTDTADIADDAPTEAEIAAAIASPVVAPPVIDQDEGQIVDSLRNELEFPTLETDEEVEVQTAENAGVIAGLQSLGYEQEDIEAMSTEEQTATLERDMRTSLPINQVKAILGRYAILQKEADDLIKGLARADYEAVHNILETRSLLRNASPRPISPEVLDFTRRIENYFNNRLDRIIAIEKESALDDERRQSPEELELLNRRLRAEEAQTQRENQETEAIIATLPQPEPVKLPKAKKGTASKKKVPTPTVAPSQDVLTANEDVEPVKATRTLETKGTVTIGTEDTVTLPDFMGAVSRQQPIFAKTEKALGDLLGAYIRPEKNHSYAADTIRNWSEAHGVLISKFPDGRQPTKFELKKTKDGYDFYEWLRFLMFTSEPYYRWDAKQDKWAKRKALRIEKAGQNKKGAQNKAIELNDEIAQLEDAEPNAADATLQSDLDANKASPFAIFAPHEIEPIYDEMDAAYDAELDGAPIEDKYLFVREVLFGPDPDYPKFTPEGEPFRESMRMIASRFKGMEPEGLRDFVIFSLIQSFEDSGSITQFRENLANQRLEESPVAEDSVVLNAPDPYNVHASLPAGVRSALPTVERIDISSGQNVLTNEVIPNNSAAIDHIIETTLNPKLSKPETIFRQLEAAGIPLNRKTIQVVESIFDRLQEASPARFDTMEVVMGAPPTGNRDLVNAPIERVNEFYSRLAQTIDKKVGKQAPASQLIGIINNSPISKEEIKWTGIIPKIEELAAASPNGKVSKDLILDYLKDEGRVIFLEENFRSNGSWVVEDRTVDGIEDFEKVISEYIDGTFRTEAEAIAHADQYGGTVTFYPKDSMPDADLPRGGNLKPRPDGSPTPYKAFYNGLTLEGGINHEETLLLHQTPGMVKEKKLDEEYQTEYKILQSLDNKLEGLRKSRSLKRERLERERKTRSGVKTDSTYGKFLDKEINQLSGEIYKLSEKVMKHYNALQAVNQRDRPLKMANSFQFFESNHYRGYNNYIAHMRTQTQWDESSQSAGLFIDEIQSDLHQGRNADTYVINPYTASEAEIQTFLEENGYRLERQDDGLWHVFERRADESRLLTSGTNREDAIMGIIAITRHRYQPDGQYGNFVADAPLRSEKAWSMQMFRRALRKAVAEGSDWIGWTSGAIQEERYGQQPALKRFYDLTLPKEVQKYVKQWGGRVDRTPLPVAPDLRPPGWKSSEQTIWKVEITPAMRASVSEGQPLFAPNQNPGAYDPKTNTLYINPKHPLVQRGGVGAVLTHEMGHFFTSYVLGEHETIPQWRKLTDKQRASSLNQYLQDGGTVRLNDGRKLDSSTSLKRLEAMDLRNEDSAMHEWMAYQFTRVVKEGLEGVEKIKARFYEEGLGRGIIDAIISFYEQIREVINRWVGLPENSTKQIDQAIRELMGFEERSRVYADPDSLSTRVKSALNAPRNIEEPRRPIFAKADEEAASRGRDAWTHNKTTDTIYREMYAALQGQLGNPTYPQFLELYDFEQTPEENMNYIETTLGGRGINLPKEELEEVVNQENRRRIIRTVTQDLSYQSDEWIKQRDKASKKLEGDQRKLDNLVNRLDKKIQAVSAADIQAAAREDLKDLAEQAQQGLSLNSATGQNMQKVGKLLESIDNMEGGVNDKLVLPYIKAIDKLVKQSGLTLFDSLEILGQLDDETIKLPVRSLRRLLRESGNEKLQAIAADQYTFAAIHIVAKDQILQASIKARKDPEERKELAQLARDFKAVANNLPSKKDISEIVSGLQKLGRIKEQVSALYREISAKRRNLTNLEDTVAKAKLILPTLDKQTRHYASELGATFNMPLADEAQLYNPLTDSSTMEEMTENALKFSWQEADKMAPEEWRALHNRLSLWLFNPENRKNKFYYNVIKTQKEIMMTQPASQALFEARSMSRQIWSGPLKHQSQLLGIPQGEEMARQMLHFQSILTTGVRDMVRNGLIVQGRRADLIEELQLGKTGQAYEQFTETYSARAKSLLEDGVSMKGVLSRMKEDGLLTTPNSIKLMHEYLVASAASDRTTAKIMQKNGLLVTDDSIKITNLLTGQREAIERYHVNVGTETFIRKPRMDALRLAMGGEALDAFLKAPNEAGEVPVDELTRFIEPLIKNESNPIFTRDSEFISAAEATEIWESVGNDPMQFLIATYAPSQEVTLEQHVKAQFHNLKRIHRIVKSIVKSGSNAESAMGTTDAPAHVAMDARQLRILPPEWVGYREASEASNKLLLTSIAFHGAFGKDASKLNGVIASANAFYNSLLNERKRIIDDAKRQGIVGDAVNKYLEDTVGKPRYLRMIHAERDMGRLKGIKSSFDGVFTHELGPNKELGAINEFLHLQVKAILNGPKSAFLQTNQLMFSPLRLGFSRQAFKQMWDQGRAFTDSFGGSLLQAIGKGAERASEDAKDRVRIMGIDSQIGTTFADEKAFMGSDDGLRPEQDDLNIANRSRRLFHIISRAVDRGFTKTGQKEAIYRTFKFFAPFTQVVGDLSEGAMTAYAKTMEHMVLQAVKYFEANPKAAADPSFKFLGNDKAMSQMGLKNGILFRDRDAFERIYNQLVYEVGLDLETHARDILLNKPDKMFTDMQYARIYQLGIDHLSSDGNYLTTRAPWLKKGAVQYLTPLLGWSATQPHNFAYLFKGPKGERNKRTVASGLLTTTLAVVPMTLAFSVLMDWWDEYLLGKKNQHRPLFSGDFLNAANERFTRMGVAGLPYELVNLFVNVGDTSNMQSLSLDQRVVLLSSIRNVTQTLGTIQNQRTATWATVGRPMFQQFGAGMLQYIEIANELGMPSILPLQEPERRYIARLNARNYLRTAGKILDLEVRNSSGAYSTPTRMTPWVTEMILSAYANDATAFWEARQKAVAAAEKMGKEDPEGAVNDSFGSRHPLKTLFRTPPTTSEYQQMLGLMSKRGQQDVAEALYLVNQYSQLLGLKPYVGKAEKKEQTRTPSIGLLY